MTKSPKFKILFCYYQPHFLQPEQIGNTEFSTVQNGWHRLKSFKIHVKMKMDKDDNRKKHIVLTPKAHAAESIVKDYIENLNDCLVQEIPEHRLEGIESALRTILDNIQQKTPRRPV